jgi:hypothetical protein
MQKLRLIIPLLALYVSLSCHAETCPPIDSIDFDYPPPGWGVLIPPIIEDQEYHFGKAVHSLNANFYYKQVICVYQVCESLGCPFVELISENTYEHPDQKKSPWDTRATVGFTLVCAPSGHDPEICQFD